MKKFLVNLLCCFVFKKNLRDKLRRYLINDKDDNGKFVIFDDFGNETKFDNKKYPKMRVNIDAKGAVLKIHQSCVNLNLICEITSPYSECIINKNVSGNISIRMAYGLGQILHIGANTTAYGARFVLDENAQIYVGENNLISTDVYIAGTDGHAIIDRGSGLVLNAIKEPLVIGDNCWIGTKIIILKNANIPNNTVVAAGAVVCKKFFEEHTIIGGNPAKVIKQNIDWRHENAHFLTQQGNEK